MENWRVRAGHGLRFGRGPAGAARLPEGADCLVVADVLSFTTSVTVAVESGTRARGDRGRLGRGHAQRHRAGARRRRLR
ncbi:hypothetical protein ACTU45_35440 [Streptomyces sp. 24-1644]|uniref:hypothetical protein n=1 Tax=Streptomyces sp. 24-1644 TaxID=3457315 RepID=UPI003FA6CC55